MTSTGQLVFRIRGMDCIEEVTTLNHEIGPLVGGADRLSFDILNAKMTVLSVAPGLTADAIREAVKRTGMTAELWTEDVARVEDQTFRERHGRMVLTAMSGFFTLLGFIMHAALARSFNEALGSEGLGSERIVPFAARICYLTGVLAGGWFVLPKAWIAARHLRPDMNLLMTVAIGGALTIGEWLEAATVAFLFGLSLALEAWSIDRARHAIRALLQLTPPAALVVRDGNQVEVPAASVATGARVEIRPGARIPLDGRVLAGDSLVDQAPITGESVPVAKSAGSDVFAGTINGDGALVIEVSHPAGDTTLARIIRMVGEAQSRRAASEQWVDRFAHVYTPTVMMLSLLVLLVPPLAFGRAWADWFYRALVLLVVACPCALVISTPVSIVAGLAAAARRGVLIKGGVHLETPARLAAIALDKTGTLTLGHPGVLSVVPVHNHTEDEVLRVIGALESASNHPVARALVAHVKERGLPLVTPEGFQMVQGKGARGRVDGREYWVGSHRYLAERGQETPDIHARIEAITSAGRTVVVLGNEEHVCALFALADAVRPAAAATIASLHAAGIAKVVMVTGDNLGTAQAIARETGIDDVHAELLPADKVKVIEELVRRHGKVAMVGDGVNDAPALAAASLGIAMGAIGSDAAIETADIALMSDDLARLPWLIHHSRRTLSVIRQNIGVSLAIKALFVVLTFTGKASLWSAIAADMGATMVVIANGLRLLR